MKSPQFQSRSGRPEAASDLRLPGQDQRLVGNNGEINASSTQELLSQINNLAQYVASGHNVMTEENASQVESAAKKARDHRDMLQAAFADENQLRELGETMAAEVQIKADRQGFMRRLMGYQDLSQGDIPQVRMQMKNVVAAVASSASQVDTQIVRDNFIYPDEFYISARPYVEQRELSRVNTDMLQQKYDEALESTMVSEDRMWKHLAQRTVGVSNDNTEVVGQISPGTVAHLRNQVSRWGLSAEHWLIASDLWEDIIQSPDFARIIDPVSQHDLLLDGYLGTIIGMQVTTDAFRHPQHKVLDAGEMYVVASPDTHGQFTDRGGVDASPITGVQEGVPGGGWWMYELLSMVIANARSVARGVRT